MTIEKLDQEVELPLDLPAILSGEPKQLADYLTELVSELETRLLFEIHQRINLMLDLSSGDTIYLGSKDSTGAYPNGTWKITVNDDGELSRDKKVDGSWTAVLVDDA